MAEADPQVEAPVKTTTPLTPAFAVRLDAVLAVKPFVSAEDFRYYLNGVNIEQCPKGGALCVATDGHRLGVRRDAEGIVLTRQIVRIPAEIKLPRKTKLSVPRAPWLVCMAGGGKGHISVVEALRKREDDTAEAAIGRVDECELRIGNAVIDGTFPEWRRVIPKEKTEVFERSFQGEYLKSFGRTISICGRDASAPHIVQTDDPAFLGVIMPMSVIGKPMPDWLAA